MTVGGMGFIPERLLMMMIIYIPPAEVCLTDLAWDYPGV